MVLIFLRIKNKIVSINEKSFCNKINLQILKYCILPVHFSYQLVREDYLYLILVLVWSSLEYMSVYPQTPLDLKWREPVYTVIFKSMDLQFGPSILFLTQILLLVYHSLNISK